MPIFEPVGEKEVTRAIISAFLKQLYDYVESDVIIIGAGPSGLVAGRELALNKVKVLVIERNNYLGGGFWGGGYLMNKATFRGPAQEILDEIGVPYEEVTKGLYVSDSVHACSKLASSACDAGAKFLNMTMFDDVVLREENRVVGVVINWSSISTLPKEVRCLDPVAIETKIVIDATGHDACVVDKLAERGIMKITGTGAMWIEKSEDMIVEYTGEVHPGLIVAGMSVTALYGLPRMGPTFGAMLVSGKKAAKICLEKLKGLF